MKKTGRTTLGLDLGIASIGWCLFQDDEEGNHLRIIDLGSFVFNQIEDQKTGQTENVARRGKRSMRRQRRRKARRLAFGKALFKRELGVDLDAYFGSEEKGRPSPMDLKIKGLSEELSATELSVALYHYLKYRGFKSNRKNEKKNKEDGKMLAAMKSVEEDLGGRHITQYLLSKVPQSGDPAKIGFRYHNAEGEFNLTVNRDWYLAEINALLDKQIEFGVINEAFKEAFLNIYTRQRDFSDGPADGPYKHDIGNLLGKCIYDGKERLPKDSYKARKFVFLSALAHFTYDGYDENGEFKRRLHLTADQIDKVFKKRFGPSKVTYKHVVDAAGITYTKIKGCELGRKKYNSEFKKFCSEKNVEDGNLTSALQDEFDERVRELALASVFFKGSEFLAEISKLCKAYEKQGRKHEAAFLSKPDALDALAYVSIRAKTDKKIDEICQKEPDGDSPLSKFSLDERAFLAETLKGMSAEATKTIDLSEGIVDKVIPYLETGVVYTEALYKSGVLKEGGRTSLSIRKDKDFIPSIEIALQEMQETLRNPVVKHTLVQLRRLLNSIISAYGKPDEVYIETGRELKKNFKDRKKIHNSQIEGRDDAIEARFEIFAKFPTVFPSIESIKHDDVLRYRLYKEQHGFSPYTNASIKETEIFSNNDRYEIDHIIPFSRSFDDSYNNKVLVETAQNRAKGNRLPYEYLGSLDTIDRFLSDHPIYNRKKRDNLRRKTFIREEDSTFLSRDASDNSYISKLARKLVETYVLPEGKFCHPVSGAMTEKVRSLWHLGGLKHSYVPGSSYTTKYRVRSIDDYIYEKMEVAYDDGHQPYIAFTLSVGGKNQVFKIEKNKKQGSKELTAKAKDENDLIDKFIQNIDYLNAKFGVGVKLTEIAAKSHVAGGNPHDALDSPEYQTFVINRLYQQVYRGIDEKDRDNHLHHAVDAAVIASCTPAVIKRITDYFEKKEVAEQSLGERVPPPYPDFWQELVLRVYERDINVILDKITDLEFYRNHPDASEGIHVLYPARLPSKDVKGAISKETIFGTNKNGQVTKTISVKEIKESDIDKISDVDGGSKGLKESIRLWLREGKPTEYPILKTKGTPIKKVRIIEADKADSKLKFADRDARLADQSDVIRVRIYKKKDGSDDFLYFVPVYYFHIWRESENAKRKAKGQEPFSDVKYEIMWAIGHSEKLSDSELNARFDLLLEFNRYSLVELTMRNGRNGMAYTGGLTNGTFEIYSILGDNFDMTHDGFIGSSDVERIRPGVNTIASVKLKNISPLGKIS